MAQPNIDKVEIVEPPIQELSKRHGTFAQGCFMGCLFFIILGVALILGIKFYLGKSPGRADKLPEKFPSAIQLYDRDNIEKITVIPGQYRTRSLQIASVFPRLLLSPLVNPGDTNTTRGSDRLQQTWKLLTAPVDADDRDVVSVQWKNSAADARFIYNFYANELSKAGYTVSETNDGYGLSFRNDTVSGGLTITASRDKKTTDEILLQVTYPSH